jgi:hypothetical protein
MSQPERTTGLEATSFADSATKSARFDNVYDSIKQMPALFLSMDLVTKLQTAISSTRNVHSERKRLTEEAMTTIDRRMVTEGWAGRLDCRIKLVKKSIRKEDITPELDDELDDLMKEQVHVSREHASIPTVMTTACSLR